MVSTGHISIGRDFLASLERCVGVFRVALVGTGLKIFCSDLSIFSQHALSPTKIAINSRMLVHLLSHFCRVVKEKSKGDKGKPG